MKRGLSTHLRLGIRSFFGSLDIFRRLARLEKNSHGGHSVYLGDNKVLTKCVIGGKHLGFIMEADDRLIAPRLLIDGIHEHELTDYFVRNLRPHHHCLDIGANFGYFACVMASRCPNGKVIAVEPEPRLAALLRDNASINCFEQIVSWQTAAVGEVAGTMTLHRRFTRSGNTSIEPPAAELVERMGEPNSEPFDVPATTIDALTMELGGRLDFIKIDVEGAEPMVMRGARQAIASNPHVKIVMEWSPGQIQRVGFDVASFIAELGAMKLQATAIRPSGLEPLSLERLQRTPYLSGVLLTVEDQA